MGRQSEFEPSARRSKGRFRRFFSRESQAPFAPHPTDLKQAEPDDTAKLTASLVNSKLKEIAQFADEENVSGVSLTLFSSKQMESKVAKGAIKDLYSLLGAEMPSELTGMEPETQREFHLFQNYGVSSASGRVYLPKGTNRTPVETVTKVSSLYVIRRTTVFEWDNPTKRPLSKSEPGYELVRTQAVTPTGIEPVLLD